MRILYSSLLFFCLFTFFLARRGNRDLNQVALEERNPRQNWKMAWTNPSFQIEDDMSSYFLQYRKSSIARARPASPRSEYCLFKANGRIEMGSGPMHRRISMVKNGGQWIENMLLAGSIAAICQPCVRINPSGNHGLINPGSPTSNEYLKSLEKYLKMKFTQRRKSPYSKNPHHTGGLDPFGVFAGYDIMGDTIPSVPEGFWWKKEIRIRVRVINNPVESWNVSGGGYTHHATLND